MCTTDGVPDGASFSSTNFSSTAELLRAGAAPGAALASTGEIQSRLAARAGLLRLFDAHDADGYASSCACIAAPGQDSRA